MQGASLSSVSEADSYEEMGKFWDSRDFVDFDQEGPDAEFEFFCAIAVEAELFASLERLARQRGVKIETLANLWLHEKLMEQAALAA